MAKDTRVGNWGTAGQQQRAELNITDDERIRAEIIDDLKHHAASVDVAVVHGVVTLSGNVSDLQQKQQIEAAARAANGVRDLVSSLTINPT